MALELTGARILAPYFGTSMYVWTSIIGIVLGALSAGYYFGGKIADKNPNPKLLSLFIFLAAILIFICALFKDIFLLNAQSLFPDIRSGATLATLILLAPASFLMGTVSPYIVRLKLEDVKEGGSVAGRLYAISTIGSIIGTFAVGFFFFEWFGNTKILLIISLLLIFCVVLIGVRSFLIKGIFIGVLIIVSIFSLNNFKLISIPGVIDVDTKYNRVWIYDTNYKNTDRKMRVMKIDPFFVQSAMFLDSDELVFDYTKGFSYDKTLNPNIKRGLVLGGAAYSYPNEFLKKFPTAHLDVVEIDPGLTELARKYFSLKESKNLDIYHEDARTFINHDRQPYDVIYVDVYSSASSVPYHLTTKESASKLKKILDKDGVLFVNLIASPDGQTSIFFKSLAKTYESEFGNVYFMLPNDKDGQSIQNIILIATNNDSAINKINSDKEFMKFSSNEGIILKDDFAPVEGMLLPVIKNRKI